MVYTDHRPLVHLLSMVDPYSRLMKFRLILEEYDFEVAYVKGRDNVVADALSRISIAELKNINREVVNAVTRSMTASGENVEAKEPEIETPAIVQLLTQPEDGTLILIKNDQRYIRGLKFDEKENIIYINWSGTQAGIVSIVVDVKKYLEERKIKRLSFFRDTLSLKFVKEF